MKSNKQGEENLSASNKRVNQAAEIINSLGNIHSQEEHSTTKTDECSSVLIMTSLDDSKNNLKAVTLLQGLEKHLLNEAEKELILDYDELKKELIKINHGNDITS